MKIRMCNVIQITCDHVDASSERGDDFACAIDQSHVICNQIGQIHITRSIRPNISGTGEVSAGAAQIVAILFEGGE
jgi:hypothetical protein